MRITASHEAPTPAAGSARSITDAIAAAVRAVSGGRPLATGIAVPGFLDARRAGVVHLSNLPALDGTPLRRELERRLRARVVLDADTNAGAVSEALIGAGRPFERVLYVTAGTGLGAALAVRGAPVRVSNHTVGHIAHLPLDPEGLRCRCGSRGCAEALLSARGLVLRARRIGLRSARTPEDLYRIGISRERSRERSLAREVWRETGDLLGDLARMLSNLFRPHAVIIGGGIAGASDLFLERARTRLRPRGGRSARGSHVPWTPVILAARGGRFAGAAGMALLARSGAP
jgi:glucokinase